MKHVFLFCLLAVFASCTEDFEELNTNPNGPTEVRPEELFRQVLYGYGNAMGREGFAGGSLLGQHFAMTDFNLFDRHALSSPQEGGDPWPIFYNALRDNENIVDLSQRFVNATVYEGPALIVKAYLAMNLTDIYGDVPYFDAVNGRRSGITTPSYDAQEEIYTATDGILYNLERGRSFLETGLEEGPLRGDILFDGDLERWSRFANGLRVKALLRIADRRDPGPEIREILASGDYPRTADDDATFSFTASPPNSFPIAEVRDGIFNVFLMSKTAERILTDLNDPRVSTLYRSGRADGAFVGIENGIIGGSPVAANTFARPGRVWRENTADLRFNFFTTWEFEFLLAEAALRGYIDDSAEEHYNRGVRLAFDYWRTELPEGYLTDSPAAYDSDRALEQIITQKWIASIGNGYEGWTEWRRTGFPELMPVAASLNDDLLPVRMPYPNEEQALNFEAYSVAAAATEGNSINARVWWDVR